ncbi:MAG: hypothetical protein EOO68_17280 [Moraxellaceae bacterium]|nr:MAG: hypothetical protein EOO68_17280 [Moraxellaceae bacterium]
MKKKSLLCGILIVVLSGCGQKGPLYLPQPAKPSPDAPKTAPAPAVPSEPKPEFQQKSTGS